MIVTASIRDLKDRLSAYLKDVQRGDVVFVTDRGRVVAELRKATASVQTTDEPRDRLRRLAERGLVKVGLPNRPAAYETRSDVSLPADVIEDALGWTRGER